MITNSILGKSNVHYIDLNIKKQIINFLYDYLEDLHKYSYNILNNISKLNFLKKNEHYVSPNYKGLNYLILFIIINNNNYCVGINRKNLSYNKNQIDIKLVNIYKLNVIDIPEILYDGTILDGKIINNSIFLIQDCYYLMGKNILNINLTNKLNQLNDILNNQLKNKILNFELKINKLYKYEDLEELISTLSTSIYPTNGLIFYPKISGINIIFIENYTSNKINNTNICSNNINNENEINNIIFNYTNILKSRKYLYENNSNTKILFLSKTDIPDVYNVYNEEYNKLCIALIPNLKISHMCNNNIKLNEYVKFNCVYSEKFKKWIPINLI
jgi:hypothetical protein